MSKNSQKSAHAKSRTYRNPPAEHRFKKGQSGNPKGRPRKEHLPQSVLTEVDGKAIFAVADQIQAIALQEIYRPVRVREGDRSSQIPAIQAIIRRVIAEAANGNASAQKQILALAIQGEASRSAAKALAFQDALELRRHNRDLLDRCEKNGSPPPDVVPHPDDMILNMESLEVNFIGPATKEHRLALDELHERREMIEDNLREAEESLAANPRDKYARRLKNAVLPLFDRLKADEAHWRIRQARKKASSHREGANYDASDVVDLRADKDNSE